MLDNAGTIRGNGSYEGAAAPADAGVMIQSAGASIDNSGTISGAGYGIVTQLYYNDETGQAEIRAVGTAVTNSGTIRGDANDAVRRFGGGSRSEERRVGTECVSPGRSRGSPDHLKNKKK